MTSISTILNNNDFKKMLLITPLLHSKQRGFTIWNLYNIILSKQFPHNETIEKFNANNSAAAFFGSLTYYIINKENFFLWLKQEGFSHTSEKIIHVVPFFYYLLNGYYNKSNYKISFLSLLYELTWSYTTGKHIFNKTDIYYKMKKPFDWYYVWSFITYGHFFTAYTKIKHHLLLHR